MNVVILTGRLFNNPKLIYTPKGKACTKFGIAVKTSFTKDANGNYPTDFFMINTWNKLAETCNKSLMKGRLVNIHGYLSSNSRDNFAGDGKQYFLNINALKVEFLDSIKTDKDSDRFIEDTVAKLGEMQEEDIPF